MTLNKSTKETFIKYLMKFVTFFTVLTNLLNVFLAGPNGGFQFDKDTTITLVNCRKVVEFEFYYHHCHAPKDMDSTIQREEYLIGLY